MRRILLTAALAGALGLPGPAMAVVSGNLEALFTSVTVAGVPDGSLDNRLVSLVDGTATGSTVRVALPDLTNQSLVDRLLAAQNQRGVTVLAVAERCPAKDAAGTCAAPSAALSNLAAGLAAGRFTWCDEGCLSGTGAVARNAFWVFDALADGRTDVVAQVSGVSPVQHDNLLVSAADPPLAAGYRTYFGQLAARTPVTFTGSVPGAGGRTEVYFHPGLGRFISVDPLQDMTDPQQWNGYTYANNNPATLSDPDGLCPCYHDVPGGWPEAWQTPLYEQSPSIAGAKNKSKIKIRPFWKWGKRSRTESIFRKKATQPETNDGFGAPPNAGRSGINRYLPSDDFPSSPAIRRPVIHPPSKPLAPAKPKPSGKRDRGDSPGGTGRSCEERNSFVRGTRVRMADGNVKSIEKVKVGDEVLATDPITDRTAVRRVTKEIVGSGDKLLVEIGVMVDGRHRVEAATITATAGHPFWVQSRARWIDALHLQVNDELFAPGGSPVRIVEIATYSAKTTTVHNLTVEDLHTYYVLAGNASVLVHNCGDAATSESSLAAAERARDQAGLKPDGTPNRESPVYVGGYDAAGNVSGTGNGPSGSGVHAEDIIQERMPGAQMTEPYAWRRNIDTGELEWKPFTVCRACQGRYPRTLFPPGTLGAHGGAWGD